VALTISLGALLLLMSLSGVASAAVESRTCASNNTWWCLGNANHYARVVNAHYDGTGNLPLAVGNACAESACLNFPGGWLMYADTGQTGVYNSVATCWIPGGGCPTPAPYLGTLEFQNQHASTHTVIGEQLY